MSYNKVARQFHWHEIRRRRKNRNRKARAGKNSWWTSTLQPPSFLPARAFSFCRPANGGSNHSVFCSKRVRASFSNCDQSRHFKFSEERVCSLAPPSAGLRSHFSVYFGIKSKGRTNSNSVFRESKRRFGIAKQFTNEICIQFFPILALARIQSKFFNPALLAKGD